MPNDAEEKKIARLDFDIKDAINSLDSVNEKLKKIAEQSGLYSKQIGKNIGSSFDFSKVLNVDSFSQQLSKVTNISEAQAKKLVTNIMKNEQDVTAKTKIEQEKRQTAIVQSNVKQLESEARTADRIKVISAEVEGYKEKKAYAAALKQEEYNNRVAQSTQSLYDKITQYAKTYVIYQGFNELKKGISETIDEMVEVEQQMVAIDRVLNESSLDIDHYRDKLIQLAADYGNSFDNVADVTLRLAQAGFDSQEALALTEKTLLALNTAELNATQATGDMVSVMSQWGLMTGDAAQEAKDYGDIIDKINKVADNYPTTSADIMEALKKVSSAFNLAGASIDETIATIVAAEKASQRGGKVIGTALSNITQQLKAEGKLNLAEELGLDFFKDADKTEFKNIIDIFQEMADRMEQLKAEGKESSTEMQSLLELFTVFRRNVGASLLGEMSGEDNTYLNVLNDSLTATGYSLQENEKYMKTAKAAQAQFNAELLKLKTEVWDKGLEDVFRGMLSAGTDLVKGLEGIIKTFGTVPTSIGVAIAAFTAFNKKIQAFTYDSKTGKIALNGFFKEVADGTKTVRNANKAIIEMDDGQMALNLDYKGTTNSLIKNTKEVAKNTASLVAQKAATIALQAATLLLNTAISIGLSIAITALVGAIDDWIHADEKAIEKNKQLMQTAQDNAEKIRAEREERENLTKELENTIKKYNQLDADDPERTDTATKLYELQTQINKQLEGSGKQISIINESLDAQNKTVISINDEWEKQIGLLNQISYQDKVKEVEELKEAMEAANDSVRGVNLEDDFWNNRWNDLTKKAGVTLPDELRRNITGEQNQYMLPKLQNFKYLDVESQTKYLNEWVEALRVAKSEGKDVGDTLDYFRGKLEELEGQQKTSTAATEAYNKALNELYGDTYRLSGYQSTLQDIMNTYADDSAVQELGKAITRLNKDFADGKISADDYFKGLNEQLKNVKNTVITDGNDISRGMQAIFAETTKYIAEGMSTALQSYENGTSTFYEYQDALSQSTQGLIELYAEQNGLNSVVEKSTTYWKDAEGNINDYVTTLQKSTDTVAEYSDMLRDLADSYDYIAEHADAAGNANFDYEQVSSEAYQTLAANFADHLSKMREVNRESWANIVGTMEQGADYVANEQADVDAYVAEALAANNGDLNAALNAANVQAQESANKLGIASGKLLEELGTAISNFDYDISGYMSSISWGSMKLFGTIDIPVPKFNFKIEGKGGSSIQGLGAALQEFGQSFSTYVSNQNGYQSLLSSIRPYKSSNTNPFSGGGGYAPPSGGGGSSGGGGGGGGGSSRTATTDAEREAQEEYKARLNAFKEFVKERERLEKRWVDKQKDLGLLSNQDYLYITQQRIERYKEYLAEVEKATWMSEEDRLALEQEYSEKIEDLETDYLKYYRTKLDDDIDALKKANQEKINLIKDEATERINALKKVEDENDRIRSKEEYEKRRLEHLEDISYWEQRTGRQAQEALKEAKKNLAELDEQWQEQMEDWSIEDQIQAIEDERDAQIQAIEDAQEAEIQAIENMYNEKLRIFTETNEIIFENSIIQSQALYNQYKKNFVDPLKSDLSNLNSSLNGQASTTTSNNTSNTSSEPSAPDYIEYTVDPGDNLWRIAQDVYGDGNLWTKIYDENEDVIGSNPGLIYPGQVFRIPQFHEGGIFNPDEGLAILKRNEMILKPEWTDSMVKLMKYFDNITAGGDNPMAGNVIQIDGNLVNIQADIKSEGDMNRLTRKIEKVLTDKFNIKK